MFSFCVALKEAGHMAVGSKVVMTFGRQKEEEVDITNRDTPVTTSVFLFWICRLFSSCKLKLKSVISLPV